MPKGMNVGEWTVTIILATVLVVILAALYPTFLDGLTDFRNATGNNTLAVALVTITPLLLIVAILLTFVFVFLPYKRGK